MPVIPTVTAIHSGIEMKPRDVFSRLRPPSTQHCVAAAALIMSFDAAAVAGPLDDAVAAIGRGDSSTAKRLLEPLAVRGNVRAQLTMGLLLYKGGKSQPKDYPEAAKWLRKSASHGDAVAQSFLGIMFSYGQGVPQDYGQAMRWYRESAKQGNADAQAALGVGYCNGQGVPQNYSEGLKWLRLSASHGNADGEYLLGFAYGKGQGVAQDCAEANRWFQKSADQGNAASQSFLGFAYATGRGVPQNTIEALKWDILAASQSLGSQDNRDAGVFRNLAVKNRDTLASKMSAAQVAEAQKLDYNWKLKFNQP